MPAIQFGVEGSNENENNNAGIFVPTIKSGEQVMVVPLQPIERTYRIRQYSYFPGEGKRPLVFPALFDENCPGKQASESNVLLDGNPISFGKPGKRYFMSVLVQNNETEEWEPKLFPFGERVAEQFAAIAEALNDPFVGRVFRVKRTGEKLDTKYSVTDAYQSVAEPEKYDVPRLEDHIPNNRHDVLKTMKEYGLNINAILTDEEREEFASEPDLSEI